MKAASEARVSGAAAIREMEKDEGLFSFAPPVMEHPFGSKDQTLDPNHLWLY